MKTEALIQAKQPSKQRQELPPQDPAQVMYQALIEIMEADAFFDETKDLQRIAARALKAIAKR